LCLCVNLCFYDHHLLGVLLCCCGVCLCVDRCLQAARAAKLLEQLGEEAEMVTVDVSHDTSE